MDTSTSEPSWDDDALKVPSDDRLTRKYRRLQSWYRETRLGVAPGRSRGRLVGSAVPEGLHAALNFLTPGAWAHAEERSLAVQLEGGTLEVDRLRRNLLSSMPMCFNVFGSLRGSEGLGELLAAIFDPAAVDVDEVVCEWAPKEGIGDRSAFDAFVRYRTGDGTARFLGIETKYTEPFSTRYYANDLYEPWTKESGWFGDGAFEALERSAAKQLWRTVMLAAKHEATTGVAGRAAVLCLAEDTRAAAAVDLVRAHLVDPERLVLVTLERLVGSAGGNRERSVRQWAAAFAERYLRTEHLA